MSNNYLEHHGILGQKWGRKNGPPYPLDFDKLSAEERKQAKEESIRNGDVQTANKNRKHYTSQELNEVLTRFDLNMRLSRASASQIKTGMDKVGEYCDKLGKIGEYTKKASRGYNSLAKVLNAFAGTDLPIVGQSSGGNKNPERKDSKDKETYKHYVNGELVDSKKVKSKDGKTVVKEYSKSAEDKRKAEADKKKAEANKKKTEKSVEKDIDKRMKNIDRQNKRDARYSKVPDVETWFGEVEGVGTNSSNYSAGKEFVERFLLEDKHK